jgi:hypothetical protein
MTLEKITATIPHGGTHVLDVEVNDSDGDDDIARRLAKTFPVGTLLGISGAKWRVLGNDPPNAIEVLPGDTLPRLDEVGPILTDANLLAQDAQKTMKTARPPLLVEVPPLLTRVLKQVRQEAPPRPGEVWKPKDPRRKSGFTIKAVTETEVIAEDGRTVSLERMKRYEKIG